MPDSNQFEQDLKELRFSASLLFENKKLKKELSETEKLLGEAFTILGIYSSALEKICKVFETELPYKEHIKFVEKIKDHLNRG